MIEMIEIKDDVGILDGSFDPSKLLTMWTVMGVFLLSVYLMVV